MLSPARALPAAPAPAWARPGQRRPRRKLRLPFPLLLSPQITGRTVWERPRSTRIFKRGVGEGRAGQPLLLKDKLKVRLFAQLLHTAVPGRALDAAAARPFAAPQDLAKGPCGPGGTQRRVRKCHDFFSSVSPPTVPTPSFLGFAAAAGERADRFCVKGLHLLSPAGRGA